MPTSAASSPLHTTPRSLEEVHRTVQIPQGVWWRRLLAFAGPAYMVSVGYMDPGNWATDLEGGARFGYQLLWVLLASNIMAVLLQTLSARLGLVTGRDLAQACRDEYPPLVNYVLFVLCEIAIAACDLAEVLGTAVGLNLLFGIPLLWAVVLTAGDVMILLMIQRLGIRKMEAFILLLVATIGLCFIVEVFLSRPSVSGMARGLVPSPLSGDALYIAIGIIGATVMPHNLYLHSALVQSRDVPRSKEGVAQACRYNLFDSAVALNAAFFVNAAILVVAAAAFHTRGLEVTEIQEAHQLLENVLGSHWAPIAFAVALLCAGQSSTLTGTLAGQITMEGFLHLRIRPWLRRLITRAIAITPAVIVIAIVGDQAVTKLLVLSQVVLSLQLAFAVVPLVKFTSSRTRMGDFVSPRWVMLAAWLVTALIAYLNLKLVYQQITDWGGAAGSGRWILFATVVPIALGLGALLLYMVLKPARAARAQRMDVQQVLDHLGQPGQQFRRIGVALEATEKDTAMLAEAVALARVHRAHLVLMHVVEGVGGQWYGHTTDDSERRDDERYLEELTQKLHAQLTAQGLPGATGVLAYGDIPTALVRLAREQAVDLMVMGGHGHRRIGDLFHGETITHVRHGLKVPLLAVRGT